jgi:hypothetical protein
MLAKQESVKHPTRCPKCGSGDVLRSQQGGLWVAIQEFLGRKPFRCRSCRARFYRGSSAGMDEEE